MPDPIAQMKRPDEQPPSIEKLSLSGRGGSGLESLRSSEVSPQGSRGVLAVRELELPGWRQGCYYAAAQRYDTHGNPGGLFPDGANRWQPLRVTSFAGLVRGGVFLLVELEGGEHLALLPVSGARSASWLEARGDRLCVVAGTFGTAPFSGDVPLLAWARAADPFEACARVWAAASRVEGVSARLRPDKRYPAMFEYLGWCSWEHFRFAIDEAALLDALDAIEASGLPIRFVLIDDGHVSVDRPSAPEIGQRLVSFRPRPDRLPGGWAPILARRRPEGVRWFGLWLNFNGYWGGIAPEHELGALGAHLAAVSTGALQAGDRPADATAFYDAFVGSAAAAGFDFVKVDNQAKCLDFATGRANGAACAAQSAEALEAACERHGLALINCMAHGPVCPFHTRVSAVTRCSEDYLAGDLPRARRHLHNSYANIPWLGQTVWGDHDMFHSNDPVSGRLMAVSKALSGGPVYLSDPPCDFVGDLIRPLCLADGRLLRPLAPAAPLHRSLFANPFADGEAYVVAAPLAGGAAAIAAYNLTEPVVPVPGEFRATDHAAAGAMLPGGAAAWPAAPEGLVLYDWESRRAARLERTERFEIPTFDHRFVMLCPLRSGWAVIGLLDKYLSPAGVEVIEVSTRVLVVKALEGGPVGIFSDRGAVSCDHPGLRESGQGFHVVVVESGPGPVFIRFARSGG